MRHGWGLARSKVWADEPPSHKYAEKLKDEPGPRPSHSLQDICGKVLWIFIKAGDLALKCPFEINFLIFYENCSCQFHM
jgi:hypothetical protein